ncbi:hypothetical protein [Natronococcus roseus]|uniref:hypothetical protein n=1 Tax=Natronococcus roseus TaxID=1052014 RepID=UPI00374CE260
MLHSKYNLHNVRKAIRDPSLLFVETQRWARRANHAIHDRYSREEATRVMDEDWDSLVILDGCRYDAFQVRCEIDGRLESRRSLGSHSEEFLQQNFPETYHDTIYVTTNPFAPSIVDDDTFHAMVPLLEEWDADYETVHPETVTRRASEIAEAYPDKRLIVHYMQPHYPFIGDIGDRLDHRGHNSRMDDPAFETPSIWKRLRNGEDIDLELVRAAYTENLDIVLEYVEELLEALSGRTVITADHGNLIGDRMSPIPVRGYGHERGLRSPELVEVPWLIVDDGARPEIRAEEPERRDRIEDSVVEERLESFGYV